jgi:hypothetical protein
MALHKPAEYCKCPSAFIDKLALIVDIAGNSADKPGGHRVNSNDETFSYLIDGDCLIVSVDSSFKQFALENEAPELAQQSLIGKSLFAFLCDRNTEELYRQMIERVRSDGRPVTVPFRCDSPTERRFMELKISPAEDGLLHFCSTMKRIEPRERVALLEQNSPRSDEILLQCGWCKKVNVGDDWLEVEAAVERLKLFNRPMLPELSHGICAKCKSLLMEDLEN